MEFQVFLHPKAHKALEKLESGQQDRIKNKLRELAGDPASKGERLTGFAYYRIRVGDFRAIYEIIDKEKKVVVLFVGHRSKVYDDFEKLL
jgi:mRNA interferase RelE/StbE